MEDGKQKRVGLYRNNFSEYLIEQDKSSEICSQSLEETMQEEVERVLTPVSVKPTDDQRTLNFMKCA
ncbi:hypothetical protein CEXT_415601 [Caerostris extrusa]|uniref:Uncharacterized protein n=1 Tax=Caerostris extrusa TaxID=172846 RepID=A0AAV4S6S0_CAEEX|nr:hypothetical protein CEXT_415601 [Caerostris extrusa]